MATHLFIFFIIIIKNEYICDHLNMIIIIVNHYHNNAKLFINLNACKFIFGFVIMNNSNEWMNGFYIK